MGFKREKGTLLLGIILLSGGAAGLGWALSSSRFHLSIILGTLVLSLAIWLFRRFSKTLREILFFFKALKNDDTSLHYTAHRGNHLLDELSQQLNELNLRFKKMKIDQELREHYFMQILEHISGGLLVVTGTGHVNHINPQAIALFGVPKLSHIKVLKGIDPGLFSLVEEMKPGAKTSFRLQYRDSGLRKNLGFQCTSINLRGEKLRIITVQDLSVVMEQKEIEDWIRLIRVMSHEIMNSLAPITSLSTTLKELWNEENHRDLQSASKVSQTIRGLDAIAEQSEGLTTFFESYRVLSRIPDPVKKAFPIRGMFGKLETLMVHAHEMGEIVFSFECSDPTLKLEADEQMITQVMLNLINNAAQALEFTKDPRVEIDAGKTGQEIQIIVSDNGPGIPADIADEIFLPFFTTRQKGTGVGLSYSRQVMKLNGGSIDFESEPGRTNFRLSWPLKSLE